MAAIHENDESNQQASSTMSLSSLRNRARLALCLFLGVMTFFTQVHIQSSPSNKFKLGKAVKISSEVVSMESSPPWEMDGHMRRRIKHLHSTKSIQDKNHTPNITNKEKEDEAADGVNTEEDFVNITEKSGENNKTAVQKKEKKVQCKPLDPLRWEFQHYQNQTGSTQKVPTKRLLIGMYSGFDSYARMLDVTASINKAYAKRWGHSTVVLQGVAIHLDDVDGKNCTPKTGVRAAFNKIRLLQYALNHTDKYDQLLLVDTDAMVYDLDYDITSMVDDDTVMLVAHRVREVDPIRGTWNVNNGVTLWNLGHNDTAEVAADWDRFARMHIVENDGSGGDQHQMHRAIRQANRAASVKAVYGPFMYGSGDVVRHYIRGAQDWSIPNPLEHRIDHLEHARKEVCDQYEAEVCDSIEHTHYGETN